MAAASRNGILVTRATPGFAASVAELGLGLIIDLARGITDAVAAYRSGRAPEARIGRQLKGATLGIIGYGVIGQHLAGIASAIGMTVLASDPYKTIDEPGIAQVSFEDLLARSDFVVCLAVATEETENLMNAAAFARMKPTAFFINLSRGNLVDEPALAAALDAKTIAGAAMDVGRAPDQMPSLDLARRAGRARDAARRRADARCDRASGLRHRRPGAGAVRRRDPAARRQCRRRDAAGAFAPAPDEVSVAPPSSA